MAKLAGVGLEVAGKDAKHRVPTTPALAGSSPNGPTIVRSYPQLLEKLSRLRQIIQSLWKIGLSLKRSKIAVLIDYKI